MKKNVLLICDLIKYYELTHLNRIMRITFFLIFVVAFQMVALDVEAQKARIHIAKEELSLRELITEIEKQTDYLFVYKDSEVNLSERVKVNAQNTPVYDVLNQVFGKNSIVYEFANNYISLRKMNEKETYTIQQQKRSVSGVVIDGQGEAVIGANVIEKGTSNGVITDIDGRFSLQVTENATLQISYIGFLMQEIRYTGQSTLTIELREDTQLIEEVVVIGYGVQQKKLVTGATVQVKGEAIESRNTQNVFSALQGQTPGIAITKSSGQPGSEMVVAIRGVGTIGNAAPLYVVDGVVRSSIDDLEPTSIESIDVLKDAASAAIYGARAANGVILVTTKRGSESPAPVITYNGYLGWSNIPKKIQSLDAQKYIEMMIEGSENNGRALPDFEANVPDWASIQNGTNRGTNWLNEAENKNAPTQRHALNIRGGNSLMTYSSGFTYFAEQGTIGNPAPPNYDRFTFFVNSEMNLMRNAQNRPVVKLGENISYSYNKRNGINVTGYGNSIATLLRTSPLLPNVRDENGDYNFSIAMNSQEANPIGMIHYNQANNRTHNHELNTNAYLVIEPTKGLVFRSSFSVGLHNQMYNNFQPVYNLSTTAQRAEDVTTQRLALRMNWSFENTLRYDFKIADNRIDVLVGQSVEARDGKLSLYLQGTNSNNIFGSSEFAYLNNTTNIVAGKTTLDGYPYDALRLSSYFARANYSFKDKYLLTAIIRTDGSSNFARGNRWGNFPSVSAGWIMSNESFMSDISWLNFLKLRASWGTNGNQSISPFQYLSTIAYDNASTYVFNEDKKTSVTGAYANILPNPDVTWEKSEQTNIGIDAFFLNSRLGMAFDWYKKVTKDWLLAAPILQSYGTGAPFINGGDIENKGIEFALNWNDRIGDFKYGVNANIATNKNKVTRIANAEGIIHGPIDAFFDTCPEYFRVEVGKPIGYFFGFKTAGVYQNQEQIDNYVNAKGMKVNQVTEPGELIFVDVNEDGEFTASEEDKTMIGDPNPRMTFGLSFNVEYKGIDFSLTSNGVLGREIMQSYRMWTTSLDNFTMYDYENRWTGPGTSNVAPKHYYTPSPSDKYISDRWIKNGNYWRISNVTLGYDFKRVLTSLPVNKFRLYASVNNIFTITPYNGMDPDVGYRPTDWSWASGIDLGFYPTPRTFMVGASVTF